MDVAPSPLGLAGRFEVRGTLGAGGAGTVYRASIVVGLAPTGVPTNHPIRILKALWDRVGQRFRTASPLNGDMRCFD